ncbi:ubiquitin-conjugating enzyme domain-containing protein [Rhizoctonia solani AG-1 IA]|uniref:Ubiquitin-conjugating enzyme domain-containing protein n=1 Tax=Thanatephorus cucumeris (strain AG1-IA) TaxID=983506 RepID=L8WZQ5_THACA|nr:ubiquitin-conjugating enzyme domain-containing protein [Rhizoctonia solani AG-1 IA]
MASKPAQKRCSCRKSFWRCNGLHLRSFGLHRKKRIFCTRGPPDCPYAGGEYHGLISFPSDYPFKPPGIKMYTPSGRFQPDKKICFSACSMSDFHPGTVRDPFPCCSNALADV